MKCARCGHDATPVVIQGIVIKPCGLVPQRGSTEYLIAGRMEGCPVSDWQDGYGDALKKAASEEDPAK